MTTTNEDLQGDISGLRERLDALALAVLQIPDLDKRVALLESFRQAAEAFQQESTADRARLREAIEAMPGHIETQVKSAVKGELTSKEYIKKRQSETEDAMVQALRKVFNLKSVGAFFATLISIIVFAERVISWLS